MILIVQIFLIFIQFAIQTTFLLASLWIMIRLQKLDYRFLPLLGSAALASGLELLSDMTLGRFMGIFLSASISTPIVCAVLCFCIAKVTQADSVDVVFTVAVGYALMFGMNLWLLGALMGDLRPSARTADDQAAREMAAAYEKGTDIESTPSPVLETNVAPNAPNAPVQWERVETNVSFGLLDQATRAMPEQIARSLTLIGLTRNDTNSSLVVDTGVRTYTLLLGEPSSLRTAQGQVQVCFEELGDDWVILNIKGTPVRLSLR